MTTPNIGHHPHFPAVITLSLISWHVAITKNPTEAVVATNKTSYYSACMMYDVIIIKINNKLQSKYIFSTFVYPLFAETRHTRVKTPIVRQHHACFTRA